MPYLEETKKEQKMKKKQKSKHDEPKKQTYTCTK